MTLPAGTRVGPYEITGPLGKGGMGEVYRARDPRLGREVAIKALPAEVAQDVERRARFEREAQLLASLNHPNIATIHGLEEADGAKYLVLELVDGKTLGELLRAGSLTVDEAVAIAAQIAEALSAAHERGIIHRDLKPGNVMVTPDHQVKVLDFGLGKSLDGDTSRSGEAGAHSPTMTMAATQAGLILGTAGYMSPEQAKGRPADRRSDVWGFGCLLYEMLAGKRAFDGEDVTEILAHVVRGEPDWTAIPSSVPGPIRTLTERCLVKDRTQRISDMSVVRFLLQDRSSLSSPSRPALPIAAERKVAWLPLAGVLAVAVLASAAATKLWLAPATRSDASGVKRLAVVLPVGDEIVDIHMRPLAVAPDGHSIVYVGQNASGTRQLFRRALGEPSPVPIAGTEGAGSPFFSPDGRWIAFFAQGRLKKVTIDGTALQVLADARDGRGGSWSSDGKIYFAPTNASGLMVVPADGGTAAVATTLDPSQGEISHRWPLALPGGTALLFGIWTGPGPDEHTAVLQELPAGARRVVIRGGDAGSYVESGFLVYGRRDGLYAIPWRPDRTASGAIIPITLPELPRSEGEGVSAFAVSGDGTLAYIGAGPERLLRRVLWLDRNGATEALPTPDKEYEAVALSPDGRQAILQVQEGNVGLWLYDFARRTLTPFATTGGSSQAAVWSADGKRVFYRGTRNGRRNVYAKAADGTGQEVRLTTVETGVQTPTSVSPDGRWLVFNGPGKSAETASGIWRLPLDRDGEPESLLQEGETNGQVSPSGMWMAYQANVGGRMEVLVQAIPGPGPRTQISTTGAEAPRWSPDGRELFYTTLDELMVVEVGTGSVFSAGPPRLVHSGRYRPAVNGNSAYSVGVDGRRFLRVRSVQPERAVTHIDVVLNWFDELERRAGSSR